MRRGIGAGQARPRGSRTAARSRSTRLARVIVPVGAALLLARPGGASDCETATLVAAIGESFSIFGSSVALRGEVAAIGAPFHDVGPLETGTAYVYRFDGSGWATEATLIAPDGADLDQFGHAVAARGDVVAVGAHLHDVAGADAAGAVYIYRFNGLAWPVEEVLAAPVPAAGDWFGWSLALDGDVLLVGALKDDQQGLDAGAAYAFRYDGHAWTLEQKLVAAGGAASDRFGWSLALDGDVAVIGAPLDDDAGSGAGSVSVFRAALGQWAEEQVLAAPDAAASDRFGWSVALAGAAAVVGAPLDDDLGSASGSAHVFRHDGAAWGHEQKLLHANGAAFDNFGWSVAAWGEAIAVGAWQDVTGASMTGSVSVFRRAGGAWEARRMLLASDLADGDEFGFALAMDGATLLASAAMDDTPAAATSGSATVFDVFTCLCEADVNGSGAVDVVDLLELLGAWGGGGAPDVAPPLAPDGVVNGADLVLLLDAWGACE